MAVPDRLGLRSAVGDRLEDAVRLVEGVLLQDFVRDEVGEGLRPEGEAEWVEKERVALGVGVGVEVGLKLRERVHVRDAELVREKVEAV